MKVDISSTLDCTLGKAWNEVQKPSLLEHVMYPLARVASVDPEGVPDRWASGAIYHCKCYVFGWIPIGTRTIFIEKIDEGTHQIQSREKDPLISRWDHLITMAPAGNGKTRYRDEIEIDAGVLTGLVWLWAMFFYRHRQRRWRALAPKL